VSLTPSSTPPATRRGARYGHSRACAALRELRVSCRAARDLTGACIHTRARARAQPLLLSRLLWQCVLPPEQYDALRRFPPPSASGQQQAAFSCRGRHAKPSELGPAFWEDGWAGYFAAPRVSVSVSAGAAGCGEGAASGGCALDR
jgi:hypothetical protein